MFGSIYFVQECPTCGRRVNIRIEYLGRQVVCQHCRGQFIARDPANKGGTNSEDLLQRAEVLLENVKRVSAETQHRHPR